MKVSTRRLHHQTNIRKGRWENSGIAAHSKICNGEIKFICLYDYERAAAIPQANIRDFHSKQRNNQG